MCDTPKTGACSVLFSEKQTSEAQEEDLLRQIRPLVVGPLDELAQQVLQGYDFCLASPFEAHRSCNEALTKKYLHGMSMCDQSGSCFMKGLARAHCCRKRSSLPS